MVGFGLTHPVGSFHDNDEGLPMGFLDKFKDAASDLVDSAKAKVSETTGFDADSLLDAADSISEAGDNLSDAANSLREGRHDG
jgi:hypothetical protein